MNVYPCGVDAHGMRLSSRPQGEPDAGTRHLPTFTRVEPHVISSTFLLPAEYSLHLSIKPMTLFRVDVIYTIGPCSLLAVSIGPHELKLPPCEQGQRRWTRVHRMVEAGMALRCVIKCCPEYYMLSGDFPTTDRVEVDEATEEPFVWHRKRETQ